MKRAMDSIPDNIEDLYVDNINNETFNKYVQDKGFLFSDITEKIIGPVNSDITPIISINSNNIEMSISVIDDDYVNVDIIKKIKEQVITDFIDNPEIHTESPIVSKIEKSPDKIIDHPEINIENIPEVYPSQIPNESETDSSEINIENIHEAYSSQIPNESETDSSKISNEIIEMNIYTENPNDVVINIDKIKPNNFFDCFNEENSVNNVISCDTIHNRKNLHELTTSYMFESEDLRKNDIYPFANGNYNYTKVPSSKGWLENLGIITASAMMLFGNND
ncbi:hypothetical protein Indivirus_2_46 [Indivirus ILV1]|uniref:Uncharacterized protein n=1 Tax=Indivirus ILV1 TaxID=1977633 RepID=A0A1V0SD81_9VIRU|nr:hypothetical protein Indivirus_2_46 [Indivirus ILV1]